jgi:hypothetical protein
MDAVMTLDPRNSVIARYIGGPLDDTSEIVSLTQGRPPMERRCAEPLSPVGPEIPSEDEAMETPRVGVYWFKGGERALDFEGLPGEKRWVEATYEWKGWS